MAYREQSYRWDYDLKASPEKLWPFVADTNRFNRDTGVPSVEPAKTPRQRLRNARQRLRLSIYGMAVEWEEQPFEWVRPSRFGVARTYSKGPMAELRALAELVPREGGGTRLTYSRSDQAAFTLRRTNRLVANEIRERPPLCRSVQAIRRNCVRRSSNSRKIRKLISSRRP